MTILALDGGGAIAPILSACGSQENKNINVNPVIIVNTVFFMIKYLYNKLL
jgi:hypothetical protein